jgi:hypothetical protein
VAESPGALPPVQGSTTCPIIAFILSMEAGTLSAYKISNAPTIKKQSENQSRPQTAEMSSFGSGAASSRDIHAAHTKLHFDVRSPPVGSPSMLRIQVDGAG